MTDLEARHGARPGARWARVGHGLYLPGNGGCGSREHLLAWQLVLPPSGVFTHLTAAREYGWWLPPLPDDLPVFVSMALGQSRPQRPELRVARHAEPPTSRLVEGVRLAEPAQVLLACARDLQLLDLVVLLDGALHRGACTYDDVGEAAGGRRSGAPRLRAALRHADARSESAWESLLRMLHVVCDVPVEPQHLVLDAAGDFVAWGDLWIRGTRTIHEYDGDEHLKRPRQRKDLARARRLGHAHWTRRGYTSYEVLRQAVGILRDADASLGRPHQPERVRSWHALLAESLFTATGTAALRRRWGLDKA